MGITSTSLKVQAELKNLTTIRNFIKEAADKVNLSKEKISELQLAVDEACANIMIHGYNNVSGDLNIDVNLDDKKMVVILSDEAPLYNPLNKTSMPELDVPLEERALGGMGVLLVKQNTDETEYKISTNGGNELIMTKYYN